MMTKGRAFDAYRVLQNLDPKALSRELTDQVVDAAQALEPVATSMAERMQKHRERLAEDEKLSEEAQAKLQEIEQEVRQEEADVDVPTLDPYQAPSVAVTRELRSSDALQPVID
jgi:hypothetical protein